MTCLHLPHIHRSLHMVNIYMRRYMLQTIVATYPLLSSMCHAMPLIYTCVVTWYKHVLLFTWVVTYQKNPFMSETCHLLNAHIPINFKDYIVILTTCNDTCRRGKYRHVTTFCFKSRTFSSPKFWIEIIFPFFFSDKVNPGAWSARCSRVRRWPSPSPPCLARTTPPAWQPSTPSTRGPSPFTRRWWGLCKVSYL